jgi:hypothetical protein
MTDPTPTCPSCRTEIKLTESLAAPLIADTRKRHETQLAQKEAEVAATLGYRLDQVTAKPLPEQNRGTGGAVARWAAGERGC